MEDETVQNFVYCTPTKMIFGRDVVEKLPESLSKYGTKVLMTYGGGSIKDNEAAEKAISATYDLYESMGIPMHLKEIGIDESRISEMAHHIAVNEGLDQPYVYAPLSEKDIEEILTAAL